MPNFGDMVKAYGRSLKGETAWQQSAKANAERAKAKVADKRVLAAAIKVKGKPWWESEAKTFTVSYDNLDQLNAEAAIAEDLGWEMVSTTATDGHVHLGRAFLTGGLTLLAKGGRSKGKTIVTWKRASATLGSTG